MPSSSARARSGHALMAGAAVLWGTVGLVVLALHDRAALPAGSIAWLRSVVAAVTLAALCAARGGAAPAAGRPSRPLMLAVGAGTAAFQTLYFAAVPMVGVAVATLIALGLAPLLVAVGESLWLGARHGARVVGAVAVSVIGLGLLVLPGAGTGDGPWALGCALAALSAAGYAAVTLVLRAGAGSADATALTAGTFAVGAVLLAPFALDGGAPLTADATTLGLVLYLGLVPSALAYTMFFAAMRTLPATASAVAVLLEPLTAAVLAWFLLGEHLGAFGVAGGVLVLAAVGAVAVTDDG